jgi:thiosulfate/3-mercaptopyruvate sulfurtransferase
MALVDVDWLVAHRGDEDLRLVDVRWYLADVTQGRREYGESHIPGALFLDVEDDLTAPAGPGRHPLPPWDDFVALLESKGIGSDHSVVAYDAADGSIAARLWWMLRHLGHEKVAVLDGGIAAWRRAGLPETAEIPSFPPAVFVPHPITGDSIDRDELRQRLGDVVLLDARAPERYNGWTEPVDPIAGHIPTALSAFHGGNVNADGTFLEPGRLRARFESLGVTADDAVVTYCGSGVTSCHNVLSMVLAGLPQPRLYPGSWSDWSTQRYPVATGTEPGPPPS